MKIAFLGGTRFIGLKSVEVAFGRGHQITVLHRGVHNAPLPPEVTEVIIDRDNESELAAMLEKLRPDVLIDTFAMTNAQTQKTIHALAHKVENVVIISSQDVYAQFGRLNGHPAPLIEDLVSEASPLTVPYPFRGLAEHAGGSDYDKKDVEDVFRNQGARHFKSITVLRLPAVYGSGDYQRRFGSIVDLLESGTKKIPCQGDASWRWTQGHVVNMAHAIVLSAEKMLEGFHVFNVGEKETPTMKVRVQKIAALLGVSPEWQESDRIPEELAILGTMPNDFVVDTTKIRSVLGYEEILSEDLCYTDIIEWCRKSRRGESRFFETG